MFLLEINIFWWECKFLFSPGFPVVIHLRGHHKDFDNWARITGDNSWNHSSVVPYFQAHEDYKGPGDPNYHGYSGELRVEAPDYIGLGPDFVRAAQEIGYPNVDLNGAPFDEGFDIIRFPVKRGVRQAPYKAFLEPALPRKTLTVRRYAQVNRILFRDGTTAYGVQYDRNGRKLIAFASKEVIISAGTMGTPKLLMLSGIGPKAHLETFGVRNFQNLKLSLKNPGNPVPHIRKISHPRFKKKKTFIFSDPRFIRSPSRRKPARPFRRLPQLLPHFPTPFRPSRTRPHRNRVLRLGIQRHWNPLLSRLPSDRRICVNLRPIPRRRRLARHPILPIFLRRLPKLCQTCQPLIQP